MSMSKALVELRGPPEVCPYMDPRMSMFEGFSPRKRENIVFEALRKDKCKIETDLGILTYPDIASF